METRGREWKLGGGCGKQKGRMETRGRAEKRSEAWKLEDAYSLVEEVLEIVGEVCEYENNYIFIQGAAGLEVWKTTTMHKTGQKLNLHFVFFFILNHPLYNK